MFKLCNLKHFYVKSLALYLIMGEWQARNGTQEF